MKVILSIFLLCAMAILIFGCNATEDETSESDLRIPENEKPQLSETVDIANDSASIDGDDLYDFSNEEDGVLSDEMVIKYAADFFETIMLLYCGGDSSPDSFEFEGVEFRYLDKNIGTNFTELEDYLSHLITPGFTEVLIEWLKIIEYKGLLALPVYDYKPSFDFSNAVITPEPDTEADKAYLIEFIIFGRTHEYTVEFMSIKEKWLINWIEAESCGCCG